MNVMWIQDGKKLTIVGSILIVLGIISSLTTHNTGIAFLNGMGVCLCAFLTIKGAIGWSWAREGQKQRRKIANQYS